MCFILRNGNFCIVLSGFHNEQLTYKLTSGFPLRICHERHIVFLCFIINGQQSKLLLFFCKSGRSELYRCINNQNPHGEDISFIKLRNGKFRACGRMKRPHALRTIGVMESKTSEIGHRRKYLQETIFIVGQMRKRTEFILSQ